FGPPTDIFDQTFKLTEVKGSDAPAMAVDRDGTIYAFTKERPPLSTTPGVTQDPLPTPEGPANLCKPASAHPDAKPWKPAPTTSTMPVAGQAGAGARLLMSRSTDDGKTWSAKAVDTTGIICVPCLTTPEAALDPSTGTIYLAFEQSDSPPPGPRDNRDIYFMRSADGGETWTPKTRLNDDSIPTRNPNYDQMFPGITVAPNGRIDVAWWDFRTNALYNTAGNGNTTRRDQTCFDIFYTSSTDGGQSWAPNTRISDRSMNQNEGYSMHLAYDVRGPVGVASADDMAFIAWQDSRNGRVELPTDDVYLATVVHDDDDGAEPAVKSSSVFLGLAIGLVVAGVAIAVASQMARGRSGA
ncbi:MAG: sialidase family protein, partial [Acidimicrobiales bacterium]